MSAPRPEKIVIQYEDGTRREAPLRDLPPALRAEILSQPFAGDQGLDSDTDRFLLLEWTDGWREVVRVDPSCTGIHRYHVITRPEDVGRLSLQKPDGYPELVEIDRKPLELARVTFAESFTLAAPQALREGKKLERHFALAQEGDRLAELRAELRGVLREAAVTPEEVLSPDPRVHEGSCELIRRKLGLVAAARQRDVVQFVRYLVRTSA